MTSPAKKGHYLIISDKMDCDDSVDSGDTNSTLTNEEVIEEENYSNHVGVKLIYFEHSYMKNYDTLCEIYETAKTEEKKLPEAQEHVEDSTIQVPVRRSLRQINKSEKDAVTNISDNAVQLPDASNVYTDENKESVDSVDNKTTLLNSSTVSKTKTKKEIKTTNGDVSVIDAELHSKNESVFQSSPRKNAKRVKLSEIKTPSEKNINVGLIQTSAEEYVDVENGDCKEKDDLMLTRPRRKRTYSEPSKSDLSDSFVESMGERLRSKKMRNLVQPKCSSKAKTSERLTVECDSMQRRKRNISAPPDKATKEEALKNTVKSPESTSKGRRKICMSLSEDSAANDVIKTEIKKNCSPESKGLKDVPKLSSPPPNTLAKPKLKKIRKDSVRFSVNDDEPALFSQPDVLVKVKTDDGVKREEKSEFEDNTQSQISNASQAIDICPKSDFSISDIQETTSQSTSSPSVLPLDNISNKANESAPEYSSEKDDSENSLHIDESVEKNFEEESIKNSEIELSDNISTTSIENPKIEESISKTHLKGNDNVKEELNSDKPPVLKTNMEDLDCDKPIAERKPRRIIKKKEFFEDITTRSSTQAKKSGGKQKGTEKKATKEESKQGKRKSTSKAEEESEDSSEDDPTKLWCICRQPHNDRFMIMCDRCEDWFHGNCVGITRQQGRKLEKLQKEWICPLCQKKDASTTENSTEKKVAPEEKKVKVENEESKSKDNVVKNIQLSKKYKTIEKTGKPELKIMQDKQMSSPLSVNNSSASSQKNEKVVNPSFITRKSFNKNSLNTSKGTDSPLNIKKGLKEPIRKKQNCVTCQVIVSAANSCYCSDKCIEKHAADCLAVLREEKGALKGSEFDSQRIVVLDRVKGNVITGDNAPTAGGIVSWLKENQNYMIACSSNASGSSKTTLQKKEAEASGKEKSDANDESKAKVRLNVRRTLKNILVERCKFADDLQMPEEDIRKIAVKIEEELNFLFKDNSFKYRAKYRSLMFNIKDPRNQGLFRKILKGSIPPDKLVRMSPEELASIELAKWREKENQHSLDMIKRVQLEQQSATGLLLKKTHKGEVEIEDDFSVIDDIPKTSLKPLADELPDVEKPEPEKEIAKDTTHHHRSHLFDLNCKICTGKMLPPPVDDITPKKVRVAHSISVDLSSPASLDPVEKSVSRIVDGKSPSSSTGDDSLDQEPTSTVSIGSPETYLKCTSDHDTAAKVALSVWKGFIFMQDVAKFVTSAYKVSGQTEYLHMDVPEIINVCGRIIPDQVWDYLGKIKQSGNKELIIIRFQAANHEEAVAYNNFYLYLSTRKRYGVVSNFSKKIKDFYILPLASTSPVPVVLMPFDGPGLPSPRPHLLLGVIVRHKVKEASCPPVFKKEKTKDEVDQLDGSYTPPLEARSYTPPLPTLQTDSPVAITSDAIYSPSMDLKSTASPEDVDISQSSIASCGDMKSKTDSEIYEPSYTPPLQLLSDSPKEKEDDKPYDPEQDILNIRAESKETNSSPKDEEQHAASDNLEKHKKILDALTKQVEETDRQVNALKQLISHPDDSDAEYHSPSNQTLDINSVAATGMSSFLDLPENLQDILNVVREKSFGKEKSDTKGDVDMRINTLFSKSFSSSNYHTVGESDKLTNLQDKNSSCGATPPLDDDENSASLRPSDPRIKIRTSFQDSFSEEPANISLSNMSVSELVERAEKELAEIEAIEKVQNVTPTQEKLVTTEIDTLPTCWSEFKEPPPPGIELPDLASPDSAFSSKTISSTSGDSLPSSFSSPLIQEAQQIAPHFPPPSIPPAFPPPLPPGFSIQTPPPNLKNFPPPSVISTSFPPPPLPVVTKANDINPVSETWPSWNISSQQSKDSTWPNRVPQWDENWKKTTESSLVDCPESNSHYYPPGTSDFHKESFYRGESSAESRWNRPQRFGRNNWHKRPPRGGRWRGRRGSFYFNKSQRN